MKLTFVESKGFSAIREDHLNDDGLRELQNLLLQAPECGDVIPGCGGLRKLRLGDPGRGKGKRGGLRIIYLNIPEAERIDLLDMYGKDEKDDLTSSEKRRLKQLADKVRQEAVAAFRAGRRIGGTGHP